MIRVAASMKKQNNHRTNVLTEHRPGNLDEMRSLEKHGLLVAESKGSRPVRACQSRLRAAEGLESLQQAPLCEKG